MLLVSGCQNKKSEEALGSAEAEQEGNVSGEETVITGRGDSASVTGRGAAVDQNVVTITAAGTYRLSGEITDGQIVVNAGKDDEINLILEGFTIANSTSSAIYGIQSGCITITTEAGTENFVSDGETYQLETGEDEPDAAIFSKDDLIFEGEGTLTVSGNYACGIRGKDDLTVLSGSYVVDAVKDGIKGKDSVEIEDGTLAINAGEDGIQASNEEEEDKGYVKISGGTIAVTAAAKGVKAFSLVEVSGGILEVDSEDDGIHSNGDVMISGGTFAIATGDDGIHADNQVVVDDGTIAITESYEGIEGLSIDINGGVIDVVSEDDGFNSAGGNDGSGNMEFGMRGGRGGAFEVAEGAYIRFAGGDVKIRANGDGIDSNGDFYLEGGTVVVEGPTDNGNGILDYNGTGTVSGGTFAGTGSSGMLQSFSTESSQHVIVVYYSDTKTAGTEWELTGSDGTALMTGTPSKDFTALIVSSPDLEEGAVYQLSTGDESSEITVAGIITSSGNAAAGTGMGRGKRGEGAQPPENGEAPGIGNIPEKGGAPESGQAPLNRGTGGPGRERTGEQLPEGE